MKALFDIQDDIQTAIAPMVILSAYSLIMLTLTNRYTDITARLRSLTDVHQMELLYRRVVILKYATLLASAANSLVLILIVVLFILSESNANKGIWLVIIFSASLVFMFASLLCFQIDMFKSSTAVKEHLDNIHRQIPISV